MLNSIFGFRNTFWSYSWWYLNMDWKWWYTSTVASCQVFLKPKMGLSENVVYPIFPMVLLIIIPTKWLFHWGYTPFSDIPKNRIQQAQKKYPRHPKTSTESMNSESPSAWPSAGGGWCGLRLNTGPAEGAKTAGRKEPVRFQWSWPEKCCDLSSQAWKMVESSDFAIINEDSINE